LIDREKKKSFWESVIYQLYTMAKEMEMHADIVLIVLPIKSIKKDQIEKMEEHGIPSILLSKKDDVLWLIGETKYKFVFGAAKDLWMQNFKTRLRTTILCFTMCVI